MRVPLVYLPYCRVLNWLGKQGELSGNCLPNLTVRFILSPSTWSKVKEVKVQISGWKVQRREDTDISFSPCSPAEEPEDAIRESIKIYWSNISQPSRALKVTELRKFLCTWFGEVCFCCCLSLLPQLAWNILATRYKDFFSALYILSYKSSS